MELPIRNNNVLTREIIIRLRNGETTRIAMHNFGCSLVLHRGGGNIYFAVGYPSRCRLVPSKIVPRATIVQHLPSWSRKMKSRDGLALFKEYRLAKQETKRCMCVLDSENLSVSGARVGRWEINRPGNLSRAPKDGTFTMFLAKYLSRTPDKSHGELASTALISL